MISFLCIIHEYVLFCTDSLSHNEFQNNLETLIFFPPCKELIHLYIYLLNIICSRNVVILHDLALVLSKRGNAAYQKHCMMKTLSNVHNVIFIVFP